MRARRPPMHDFVEPVGALRRSQLARSPRAFGEQPTIGEAAGAEGLSPRRQAPRIVGHEKEGRPAGPKFASSPLKSVSVGRGHRGASMAPMMPRPNIKTDALFVPTAKPPPARDGGGLFLARSRKELARRAKGGHESGRVPHRPPSQTKPARHLRTPKRPSPPHEAGAGAGAGAGA